MDKERLDYIRDTIGTEGDITRDDVLWLIHELSTYYNVPWYSIRSCAEWVSSYAPSEDMLNGIDVVQWLDENGMAAPKDD